MNEMYKLVKEFNIKAGFECPKIPTIMTESMKKKRVSWLSEEIRELEEAVTIEDQVDAICDILYFAFGCFTDMGVIPDDVFRVVHEHNMKKIESSLSKKTDGKVAKPLGWVSPETKIRELIDRQRNRSLGRSYVRSD